MQFDYALNLQNFMRTFFDQIEVSYLILRDEESLPMRSGFDIDILIDKASSDKFINSCAKIAEQFNWDKTSEQQIELFSAAIQQT